MQAAAIILIVLSLGAIIAALAYFIYDYVTYKHTVDGEITTATTSINSERQDRLSNLKYVVDQVNTVNDNIYNTTTSNLQVTNTKVATQSARTDNLIAGFGKILSFNSTILPGSPSINLTDLPGSVAPNMNLMQHVTAVMGLTASNLSKSGNSVAFCSQNNPNQCIKFPDNNGNTYLTTLDPAGSLVFDGNIKATSNIAFGTSGTITPFNNNSLLIQTTKLGVGPSTFANPGAELDIQGQNATDPLFRVTPYSAPSATTQAGPAIMIDATGNLNIYQPINIFAPGAVAGSQPIATLQTQSKTDATTGTTTTSLNLTNQGKNLGFSIDGDIKARNLDINNIKIGGTGTMAVGGVAKTLATTP